MPRDTSINSVLVIGAGPIVIGQACEFDYSGVQACLALREENCRIILINSNPATIMTDTDMADATYIEPMTPEVIEKIIIKEQPQAILPIVGGQTALNCTMHLVEKGILQKHSIKIIGVSYDSIVKAENRERFKLAANNAGVPTPYAVMVYDLEAAIHAQEKIGFPVIVRTSFTLGGSGSGIAYHADEFKTLCLRTLSAFPGGGILIEECIAGWKEYELEIMLDSVGNNIVVCSIENIDPMGIHTGDSITVAPAQTLTDKEYQLMRSYAFRIAKEIGMTTGGCNVQFAVNSLDGRMFVIEINPRVSRSSALASKATGFPIAKIATQLALGYTLDEIKNPATGNAIPASFEPTLDYVVTKLPRFNFEKFPGADTRLTTEMKSVGEVMGIGRNFKESLQKAICSLEIGFLGLDSVSNKKLLKQYLLEPNAQRLWVIADAFRHHFTLERIHELTSIDPWFLRQIQELVDDETEIMSLHYTSLNKHLIYEFKQKGFSDARIATLMGVNEQAIREYRNIHHIHPVYKCIDSCAGEFRSTTAYFYSTYDEFSEIASTSSHKKILIIGSGPNRIGQGIEFDYCCVHAVKAVREAGYQSILVNCNPETVSTDYNLSDRLYFEPLTLEHLLEIISIEKPIGVLVQFGGQTPLHLAAGLEKAGSKLIGISADTIDITENRKRFKFLLHELNMKQPLNATFMNEAEALYNAKLLGYPLVLRPSYVIGGRAISLINNEAELCKYLQQLPQNYPAILMEQFLENALEVEVDAISDGKEVLICGITEQLEMAGIHSGDSSCCFPAISLTETVQKELENIIVRLSQALDYIGFINIQFAIYQEEIFILEINLRASRTIPFLSKATGLPLVKIATRCLLGERLKDQEINPQKTSLYYSVKMPVFPFKKFPGSSSILGMEMKSTGEVMGIGTTLAEAFLKAKLSSGLENPTKTRWEILFPPEVGPTNNIFSLQEI